MLHVISKEQEHTPKAGIFEAAALHACRSESSSMASSRDTNYCLEFRG